MMQLSEIVEIENKKFLFSKLKKGKECLLFGSCFNPQARNHRTSLNLSQTNSNCYASITKPLKSAMLLQDNQPTIALLQKSSTVKPPVLLPTVHESLRTRAESEPICKTLPILKICQSLKSTLLKTLYISSVLFRVCFL